MGLEHVKAEAPVEEPRDTFHLTEELEPGTHAVVELATPSGTIVYDQGTLADGVLDLSFPVPEEGDSLLRIVAVQDDGTRENITSEVLKVKAAKK